MDRRIRVVGWELAQMNHRVLITCRQMQDSLEPFRARFEASGIELVVPTITGQHLSEDELTALVGDVDGVIAGDDPFTARVLSHAQRLRTIAKWGIGLDAIDLEAARRQGIEVTNTPGVFGEDVADVAIGYMVMLARSLHRIHDSVRSGGWLKPRGVALNGRCLGIAGFGSIGQAVGRRGAGFGMDVLVSDVATSATETALDQNVTLVSKEQLLARADFLVLCLPLTPATHHFLDGGALAQMRHGAFLINVARGQLIDETALIAALEVGKIGGAALDVFEHEPLPHDSRLRQEGNCVFGSHNGSNTSEGVMRASDLAVTNLLHSLEAL